MKKRTPVSAIMTANPQTVNVTNSLREVHALFQEGGYHHLPVVSGNKLIGIISKMDIERISFVSQYQDESVNTTMYDVLSIEQVMTKDVEAIQQNQTIRDASVIFSKGSIHALPVLENDKVVGIVTTTDVVKYLLDQL